jgi:hypothetical protein
MTPTEKLNPFINQHNRLRSFWRALVFIAFTYVALFGSVLLLYAILYAATGQAATDRLLTGSVFGFAVQASLTFGAALLIGWVCGKLLEKLPLKALGWCLHAGWLRDLTLGAALGAVTLLLAAGIGSLAGATWRFNPATPGQMLKTIALSAVGFFWFAAAEEVAFRGYALQTLTRAGYAWAGLLLTSVPFALAHLDNPNVSPFFTFTNTALAGVWLGVAYWKTRSLWFPQGLHWAWNWTMGSIVGLPVSGITEIAPAPLLKTTLHGPKWLTGGAYGVEGGIACTVAILLSTFFIWRTGLVKASEEMSAFDEKSSQPAADSGQQNEAR